MNYIFRLTVRDIEPPIYRVLIVPSNLYLDWFHDALQRTMNWYVLDDFEFRLANGRRIGRNNYDYDPERKYKPELKELESIEKKTVKSVFENIGEEVYYLSDYEQYWECTLVLEEIDTKGFSFHPILLDGKRRGPMEAFCGSYGYDNAVKAYFDPSHKYHKDSQEWLGENFDPEEFDAKKINEEFMSWHVDGLPWDAYGFGYDWQSYRALPSVKKL